MPSVNSFCDAARSLHTLQLSEVPLCRAGKCHDHHFAGRELVCRRFSSLSRIALAELGFETQTNFPTNIHPQNHPSSLDACVPSNRRLRKELLQTNAIIPTISGHRGIPRWGQKGGNLLQMWKRSDVVCVQMWYQHWGTQLFLILQAFLMVLEKWAVKLCNQKKKSF